MQLAILVVLVLIAVLIAPWLFGVVLAAAAVYSLWLIVAVLAVAIGGVFGFAWVMLKSRQAKTLSDMPRQIEQANQMHRAREAALVAGTASVPADAVDKGKQSSAKGFACPHCGALGAKFSLYCAECGRAIKPPA